MKKTAGVLLVCAVAAAVMAQESPYQAVGSMSQLMINIIYPTSNTIFYVVREAPKIRWSGTRWRIALSRWRNRATCS